jgi:hypothetical protein
MSNGVANGTSEVILARSGTHEQEHAYGASDAERPADVPANYDPQLATDSSGSHLQTQHVAPYPVAVDSQGNADCVTGQLGYYDGPVVPPGYRFTPEPARPGESVNDWQDRAGGGSHVQARNDLPGLAGPTYVAKRLGINGVKDVP